MRLLVLVLLAACAPAGEQLCEAALEEGGGCDACGWTEGGGLCGDIDPPTDCSTLADDDPYMACVSAALETCDWDAFSAC